MPENKGRQIEAEIEINASPEAVWKMLATSEGVRSWFAPMAKVEPGVGGSIWVSWGEGMDGTSRIEAWEDLRHQRYAHDQPGGGEPKVVDWTLEGKGGATTLRLVHSGFGADAKFDNELESSSRAWRLFLAMIKHGAEHPAGRPTNVTVFRMLETPRDEAARKLLKLPEFQPDAPASVYHDPRGYAAAEIPDSNHSLLTLFVEKCGPAGTMLTIMNILHDQTPEQEEATRARWTSLVDTMFGAPK